MHKAADTICCFILCLCSARSIVEGCYSGITFDEREIYNFVTV